MRPAPPRSGLNEVPAALLQLVAQRPVRRMPVPRMRVEEKVQKDKSAKYESRCASWNECIAPKENSATQETAWRSECNAASSERQLATELYLPWQRCSGDLAEGRACKATVDSRSTA